MAILPASILFIGAIAAWLARRRSERIAWGTATLVALVAWGASLGLAAAVPSSVSLSAWRPSALFAARLELRLDSIGWQFVYAAVTLLLAVQFTAVARPAGGTRAMLLGYTGTAVLAMLAANLLTVATAWALMDLAALFFLVGRLQAEGSAQALVTRMAVDMGGVLLAVGAALAGASHASVLAAGLLALAALLRLGLLPPHFSLAPLPQVRRGPGTLLRLLPPAAALAVVARQFAAGVPAEAVIWLRLAGTVGALAGGMRWFLEPDAIAGRPYFVVGVSGLGVLAAGLAPERAGAVFAATGALLLLAGAVASLAETHTPVHRLWPAAAALLLAGLPGTPGGVIAGALGSGPLLRLESLLSLFGIAGMALLVVGTLRMATAPIVPWPSGETLVRTVYGLGLALPVLVAVGVGLRSAGSYSVAGGVVFLAAAGLSAGLGYNARRLQRPERERWERLGAWLDPEPLYRLLWRGYRALMRLVRGLGDALEGEGAVLWMIVILLLAVMGLRGGGR